MPITSFTMAMTTFISQNLGAKQHERAKQSARFGIFMTALLAELIGVVVFIFAPQLIAAFDSNPAVVEIGVEKARTSALFFFLLAYSHAVSAILRGAGKAVVPMMVMMIFWCVVRVAFLMITVPLTHSIRARPLPQVPAPRTPIFFFVTFVSSVSAPRKGHCALCGEFAPVPGQARCALLCSLYTKAGAPSTACRIAQSFPDGSSVFVHITRFEQTVCTPSGFML